MTKEKAEKVIRNLIKDSYDSGGQQMDCSFEVISKVLFERYTNATVGSVKLFKYSSGKQGNNKPYTYSKQITVGKFILIDECFSILLKHMVDNDSLDDLLSDEPKDIDDYEDVEEDF